MSDENLTGCQSKELKDEQYQLLHLSQISLVPKDIVSISWRVIQPFSGKQVTKIRTRWEVFILDSDSPNYQIDCEDLEKSVDRHRYQA